MYQSFTATLLLAVFRGDRNATNIDLKSGAYILGVALGEQTEEHMIDRGLGKGDKRLSLPDQTIRTFHIMVRSMDHSGSKVFEALTSLDAQAADCADPQSDDLLSTILLDMVRAAYRSGQWESFLSAAKEGALEISFHRTGKDYFSKVEAPGLVTITTMSSPIQDHHIHESCGVVHEIDLQPSDKHSKPPSTMFLTTLFTTLLRLIIEQGATDLLAEIAMEGLPSLKVS